MSNEMNVQKREDSTMTRDERPRLAPAVDIYENADEVLIVADLPGVKREDIGIRMEKSELTIEGRRSGATDGGALASEYRAFDYRRAFHVPQGIDGTGISAELANGVLKVRLPKVAALKPRRIAVQAG